MNWSLFWAGYLIEFSGKSLEQCDIIFSLYESVNQYPKIVHIVIQWFYMKIIGFVVAVIGL